MNIEILPKDVLLTPADETYIRNRLYFAVAGGEQDIDTATVSLCTIPGFESEEIQHCRVEIDLLNGCAVIGDSSESDIYVAIDRAIERSCRKVTSTIEPQSGASGHHGAIAYESNSLSSAA